MELNIFIKELEASLVRRGINPEVANKHVHTLQRTFTDDDLNEIDNIQSDDEVEDIADNIALILMKNKIKTRPPQQTTEAVPPPPRRDTVNEQLSPPQQQGKSTANSYYTRQQSAKQVPVRQEQEEVDDFFEDYSGEDKTTKGFYTFWLVFIFTLPITAVLAAAFFGIFIGTFVVLASLIVGLIAGLIGIVAVGAGVSLVGIIFGVTQLFTFASAGVYEIGLGIIVIGIVMFVSILIYNIAIHFLPWVMKKVGVLLKFTCGKIRDLFLNIRRECYRL